MPLTGNKGEWSEIYVFLRLLATGKLFAADADLNKNNGTFYNILNVLRTENGQKLEFRLDRSAGRVSVVNSDTNTTLTSLPFGEFETAADKLYNEIVAAKSPSFSVVATETFLNSIQVYSLKAKSTDKSDIRTKVHDINTGIDIVQGFSIKSRLGSPSTLINAGRTTNFIYEVTGPMTDAIMNNFNTCSKLFKNRFAVLDANKCDISYYGMENDTFENNLLLLDGNLPEICAEMLKAFFSLGITTVKDAISHLNSTNPLKYDLSKGHPFYSYKFKKLLTECALGMLPSKTWDGTADATGGYIIVREDGEVLCYHLFNRNEFENYLLNNTKFETGSTSRHGFGAIYKENGKYYLKLNLQVRFIK